MGFPSTVWSQIRSGDHVVRRYTEPVYRFLMLKGVGSEDARELTQDVMVCVLRPGFLDKADRKKGKFRSLLLTVTEAVRAAWLRRRFAKKRGGGRRAQVLDEATLEALVDPRAAPADELFEALWSDAVLRRALERLAESSARGAAIVELLYFQGKSHAEVAVALGISLATVRNTMLRLKPALRAALEAEIRSYCSSDAELQAELADLRARLG